MMIIAVPKQMLTSAQRKTLEKKGFVVIECDEPEKVRVINVEQNMDTNDWFMSALYALTSQGGVTKQEIFINSLYARLKKKELSETEQKPNP